MDTQVIKIETERYPIHKLRKIVSVLKKDGVIVYPTETFYGLGANCFSVEAVNKIFALKKRNKAKPLPVVISERGMLDSVVAAIPPVAEPFLREYWPGPLTLIFPAHPNLPEALLGGTRSIGVRLPAKVGLRELVRRAGCPITATSANISGEEELSDPKDVLAIFGGRVDCIVDGGKTKGGLPTTVVDLTSSVPYIRREGAVPSSELLKWLER